MSQIVGRSARVLATLGLITFLTGFGQQAYATTPVPYIVNISPVTAAPGGASFTLTVNGANFVNGSTVYWVQHVSSVGLPTTFVSSTQVTATVGATEIASATSALIVVKNPVGSGSYSSNEVPFIVTLPTTGLFFRLTTQSPSGGNHPNVPVFGDFNGDGILDLAVSNENLGGAVSIFYGNGNGSFTGAINSTYSTGLDPEGVAVGDFNEDGYLDLAVANMGGSSYTILLGSASGTFTPTTTDFPIAGTQPYAIAAADFNGDGILDLAVACQDPSTGGFVYILLGNGDGTFGTPDHYGALGQPYGLALADYNGDGFLDLAVSDFQNNGVWILTGSGTGTFSSGTFYSVSPGLGASGLVTSDFNGDNEMDLAVSDLTSGQVTILLNSSGTFTQSSQSPIAIAGGGYFLGTADLNGDGFLDLAIADYTGNSFSSLLGNGDGTFQPYTGYLVDPNATSILGLALADVNSDGRIDVVTTDLPDDVVEVLLQAGNANFSPSSLTFPNTNVGVTSAGMMTTLSNNGSAELVVDSISTTDTEFVETNTCGSFPVKLWVGQSCNITITFTPAQEGSRSGSLSITDNQSSTAQTIPLSGVGLAPEASLGPSSLSWSNVFENTSGATQNVTLTNSGNAALTITSISVSSDYSETNTCGSSVAAGSSCTISVVFKPTSQGTISGTLTVSDNSNYSTSTNQTSSLSGTAVGPTASLGPATLTYASQLVGTSSATQNITLSNTGTAALTIASVAISGANAGDFSQTNTCGTSVAAGGSCAITVTFKPTATGTRTGTITVTDNTGGVTGSTQLTTLTGTAVAPVASVPSSLPAFAATLVGTSSAVQAVTVSNTGGAALTITSIVVGGTNAGDFSQTNNCGTSLAAGANCSVSVTFKPTATGSRSATVTLTDNSNAVSGTTESVSISGTGTAPVVSGVPASLAFADQLVGTASPLQPITLSNATGTAALTITSIAFSGANSTDFAETNTCGTSVAAGSTCAINVTFTPGASGARSGSLTITDNNNAVSGSTQVVSLTGTGIQPVMNLSTASLTFSSENVGTASPVQPVTITNSGTAALSLTSITVTGDYTISNPCGSSLAAGANCTVNVTFKPTAVGSRTGTLTVTGSASPATQTVSLTGTGLGAEASLSSSSLTFSAELVGVTSAAQSITVKNTGNAAMTITSIAAGGDFTATNTCGSSVAAGASCTVSVTFKAAAGGSRTATLTLTDNAVGGNQTVALSGTGQDFTLTATTTSASVTPGQTASYTLTLTPSASFNETVALSCSGLSSTSEASCSVSPTSVTPTAATSISVTVTTTAASSLLPMSRPHPTLPGGQGEWLLLAILGLAGMTWLVRRRPQFMPVGMRLALVTAGLATVLAIGMTACGSGKSSVVTQNGGTPTGNYTISVAGAATSGSVTDTHTVSLTMTVQ